MNDAIERKLEILRIISPDLTDEKLVDLALSYFVLVILRKILWGDRLENPY